MSSGGGGGQSGETRYNWNPTMEAYWTQSALPWAAQEASRGYTPYQGDRVADLNSDINISLARNRELANTGGPGDTVIGRNTAANIAGGNQLSANPYQGLSPTFNNVLQAGADKIVSNYNRGTAADTTRMFNLSGAFGSNAHQDAMRNNQSALAEQLGNYTSGMLNQQYDRSGNMYESALGRQMQAIPLALQGQGLTNDLNDRVMRGGEYQRGYEQQNLDSQYGQWNEAMNYGRNLLDWYGNFLGRAQGSTGVTTQTQPYSGTNPFGAAAGAGLLGNVAGLW